MEPGLAAAAGPIPGDGTAEIRPAVRDGRISVASLFRRAVEDHGEAPALREKRLGLWETISWRDYGDRVKQCALGLLALGIGRGDVIAIVSRNRPEWLYAEMAAVSIGAVVLGIRPNAAPEHVADILAHCTTRIVFLEDGQQLIRIASLRGGASPPAGIVLFDEETAGDQAGAMMGFAALCEAGRIHGERHPASWEDATAAVTADDAALLACERRRSGPRVTAVSHANLLFQITCVRKILPAEAHGDLVSLLPLSELAEQLFTVFLPLDTGTVVHFVESSKTLRDNLREVRPTMAIAGTRLWRQLRSEMAAGRHDASPLGRWAFDFAMRLGARSAAMKDRGKRKLTGFSLLRVIGDMVARRRIRGILGLDRARMVIDVGADAADDLAHWYLAMGVDFREAYGEAGLSGLATFASGRCRPGTHGRPLPGTELRIADSAEILVRGGHVAARWPAVEARAPGKDGEWFATGRAGSIDEDGCVTIGDMFEDMVPTDGGPPIGLSDIERRLAASPYIVDAVASADASGRLGCMIILDAEHVLRFAQANDIHLADMQSLSASEPVRALIGREIEAVNRAIRPRAHLSGFEIATRRFTDDDPDVIPNLSLEKAVLRRTSADHACATVAVQAAAAAPLARSLSIDAAS